MSGRGDRIDVVGSSQRTDPVNQPDQTLPHRPGHADWLRPRFTSPQVGALMSTRAGGISVGSCAGLNLGDAVGDDPAAVQVNRTRFAAALGGVPTFLRQVHGTRVLQLSMAMVAGAAAPEADASLTTEPGVACLVQAADCLPVLFAAPGGRGVAAAHAGWRGLAGGVLEATVAALCEAAGCNPAELEAWLGPCIGPRQFEVGAEVLRAFGAEEGASQATPQSTPHSSQPSSQPPAHPRFQPARPGHWRADLAGLAGDRLRAMGLSRIEGGRWCTVEDASRFFSYRRDRNLGREGISKVAGQSGRMAAAIWIEPAAGPGRHAAD